MNVIKPPLGPVESVMVRQMPTERQRSAHPDTRTAVAADFSQETMRQVYDAVVADRAARIDAIKAQVKSGRYRPNLEVVADRLLSAVGHGFG